MLTWDNMDDYLKTVALVHWQVSDVLRCYYQLEGTFKCFDKDLKKTNLAPIFFGTAVGAMRYQIIVGTAKLFDDNGSAGIPEILNLSESHPKYGNSLKPLIVKSRAEYKKFKKQARPLRKERNQFYAHLDRRFLLNDGKGADFEWENFEPMLKWAVNILSEILHICGSMVPPLQTRCDLQNLLDHVQMPDDA